MSDMNTALTGGGQLVDSSADLDAANDNVVFQTLTDGATLATGAETRLTCSSLRILGSELNRRLDVQHYP